ncbi:MAG: sigma-54 dependent transcriptional regulator [Myxococcota bacterium]
MTTKGRILVVDDERSMQEFLEIFFRREGFEVVTAGAVESALLAIEADDFDLVVSDVQMPGRSGLEVLRAVKASSSDTIVVMITAFASTESAIAAMKEGAYDYITKPFKLDELSLVVEKALEKKLLSSENRRLRSELRSQLGKRSLIGNSPLMQRVYELIGRVADTKTNVLIGGESGTGKELVARAIHDSSDRQERPFVAVNCGAIPENLLESELFGHVKGAFTGAVQNKPGLFEVADGGTLFFDEVGELPGTLQVKLLRVIQEKKIRRVGGTGDREVDVRILSATNRRLEEEVAGGRFREDLYYRLNVIEIPVPALRDRMEDLPLLIHHFVERYAEELRKPMTGFDDEAMRLLLRYHFPGNVRELENIVERAVALCRTSTLDVEALPPNVVTPPQSASGRLLPAEGAQLDAVVNDFERKLLLEALERSGGVKKRAASLLGISFRSFRYRLEKLGLDDPGSSDG